MTVIPIVTLPTWNLFFVAVGNFLGDETHSLVSDSWSTDVLASDSEYQYREDANASALPDVVPGQPPDIPRLDLIAEESANVVCALLLSFVLLF